MWTINSIICQSSGSMIRESCGIIDTRMSQGLIMNGKLWGGGGGCLVFGIIKEALALI